MSSLACAVDLGPFRPFETCDRHVLGQRHMTHSGFFLPGRNQTLATSSAPCNSASQSSDGPTVTSAQATLRDDTGYRWCGDFVVIRTILRLPASPTAWETSFIGRREAVVPERRGSASERRGGRPRCHRARGRGGRGVIGLQPLAPGSEAGGGGTGLDHGGRS